jgi:precorrin-6B methylase 2
MITVSNLSSLYNYFLYKLKSTNEHGVHSPFVFDLVTNVVYNNKDYYCYKTIEAQRKILLDSNTVVGSLSVSELAKKMPAEKYSKLLFRLVNYFQPNTVGLINDNLGVDTAYTASVSEHLKVYSLQGNKEFQKIITSNLKQLKLKNVTLLDEPKSVALPNLLKQLDTLDFVVIHQKTKEEVLSVFYQYLEKANTSSVFVISNVGLPEISDAWEEIKNNNQVTVTIDLFYMGIVFLRKEQVKEHFLIRF